MLGCGLYLLRMEGFRARSMTMNIQDGSLTSHGFGQRYCRILSMSSGCKQNVRAILGALQNTMAWESEPAVSLIGGHRLNCLALEPLSFTAVVS